MIITMNQKSNNISKHGSCNRVHQTGELTSEKQKLLLVHRRLLTSLLSQIDGLQTFSYKSHVPVADCETCCVRDSRRNNGGGEKSTFRKSNPFEILLHVDKISCPKRNNTQIKNWIAFKYDNISSTNKLTDIFPDSSPNDVTKNTFETTHLCVEQTNTRTMIHCTNLRVWLAWSHTAMVTNNTISISHELNAYWKPLNIVFEPTGCDHPYHTARSSCVLQPLIYLALPCADQRPPGARVGRYAMLLCYIHAHARANAPCRPLHAV